MIDTIEKPNSIETIQSIPQSLSKHLELWKSPRLNLSSVLKPFPDKCVDEIDAHISSIAKNFTTNISNPIDTDLAILSDANQLSHCRKYCAELAADLTTGLGIAVVDRIPSERYSDDENRYICGLLASLVAPLMAQTHDGVTLYDVKDRNVKDPTKVRRSITNLAQQFHTDGGWLQPPAQLIGLYCIRNAAKGGGSHVTSLVAAYDALAEKPNALQALSEGMPWDKQGEHSPTESPIETLPIFEVDGKRFKARFYESYVRNGYTKIGKKIPNNLDSALANLSTILNQQPRISFDLKPGQFQYLNNWVNVHSRDAFDDDPSGDASRYLIRVWNTV